MLRLCADAGCERRSRRLGRRLGADAGCIWLRLSQPLRRERRGRTAPTRLAPRARGPRYRTRHRATARRRRRGSAWPLRPPRRRRGRGKREAAAASRVGIGSHEASGKPQHEGAEGSTQLQCRRSLVTLGAWPRVSSPRDGGAPPEMAACNRSRARVALALSPSPPRPHRHARLAAGRASSQVHGASMHRVRAAQHADAHGDGCGAA
jgi:hypothetical protein